MGRAATDGAQRQPVLPRPLQRADLALGGGWPRRRKDRQVGGVCATDLAIDVVSHISGGKKARHRGGRRAIGTCDEVPASIRLCEPAAQTRERCVRLWRGGEGGGHQHLCGPAMVGGGGSQEKEEREPNRMIQGGKEGAGPDPRKAVMGSWPTATKAAAQETRAGGRVRPAARPLAEARSRTPARPDSSSPSNSST